MFRCRVGIMGYRLNSFGHTKRPGHRLYRIGRLWLDVKWGKLARQRNAKDKTKKFSRSPRATFSFLAHKPVEWLQEIEPRTDPAVAIAANCDRAQMMYGTHAKRVGRIASSVGGRSASLRAIAQDPVRGHALYRSDRYSG